MAGSQTAGGGLVFLGRAGVSALQVHIAYSNANAVVVDGVAAMMMTMVKRMIHGGFVTVFKFAH